MIEGMRLNEVDKLARLAGGWNKIEPAPRQHGLIAQPNDAPGQYIKTPEVVQQPAVEAFLPNGILNGTKVKHRGFP
jgi:hypothetical protein